MTKLAWGSKRVCQSCHTRFYDLNKMPIVCPKCDTELLLLTALRQKAKAVVKEKQPIIEDESLTDIEIISDDDDDVDLIEDTSELEDGLDDVLDVNGKDSDTDVDEA